jgi:purine-binding chemotaxis protein CheW
MSSAHAAAVVKSDAGPAVMYVTMRLDKQLIGISVDVVRDVLLRQAVTPIPLAAKEIAGSLNLRGRIVTVIDVRRRLNLPERVNNSEGMFVVVEHKNDLYSLIVDSVGEVLTVSAAETEKTPANLNGAWKDVAMGIHKLSNELLVIIDIHAILTL